MKNKDKIKSFIPPQTSKEILDARFRRIEILEKIDKIKLNRQKEELLIEEQKLRNEELKRKESGFFGPIEKLVMIAGAYIIDNERSTGTEPAFRSLWDNEDLNLIRVRLLKKVKEL